MLDSDSIQSLAGIKVVEFTHAVLGPTCGMLLADFGAEVVRIEPPSGDPTRRLKGFGMGYHPFFNRNKTSVRLDLKTEDGLNEAGALLAQADVVVENFGPGTMDRLGLGYDELKERFPALIYVSLKGFLPGPYQRRTALDEVVQMMSGLAYMTGPPGQPLRAGASVIDISTGIYGALGVLLALRERDRTGEGSLVQGALFETAAFLMGHHMAYSAVSGEAVPPMPDRVSAWSIYHQFRTKDGQLIFVGVTSDKQWPKFCDAFERPDWAQNPTLKTNNARIEARDWLLPEVRELIGQFTLAEAVERCERANLPFSPIAKPEDLFTDPQLLGSQSLVETQLPDGGQAALPRQPIRINGAGSGLRLDPSANE
jgi:crotonobetainyl-CoA:carnitine CoA-transferase CaiB-like acyl-CoA transferase